MNKYRVATIRPAGNGWYRVLIIGPLDIHMPVKWKSEESEQKIRDRAQVWCNTQNRALGLEEKKERRLGKTIFGCRRKSNG